MKQLTGVDVSFLLMETDNNYGHVNGLSIYDRPSDDFDPFTAVRERMRIMVGHLEPLRRKVVEVPFSLDRPYWVEDGDFDLDYHVREIALPKPGSDAQLAQQVARIMERPLDRKRPLWELYVIHGLKSGLTAMLSKIHHAVVDGISGAEIMGLLLDTQPEGRELPEPPERSTDTQPGSNELVARALMGLPRYPLRLLRALPSAEIGRAHV